MRKIYQVVACGKKRNFESLDEAVDFCSKSLGLSTKIKVATINDNDIVLSIDEISFLCLTKHECFNRKELNDYVR